MSVTERGREASSVRLTAAPQLPHRPWHGRISSGHLLMVLAALVAVALNLALLRSGRDSVPIAVADTDVAAGTPLAEVDLRFVEIGDPGDLAVSLLTPDSPLLESDQDVVRPIAAGEPLRTSDLRSAGVEDGLRQMAIEIDPAQAVGGRLAVGDTVDVVATVDGRSEYVATGLEVKATPEVSQGALPSSTGYWIVVAVDDQQVLRIAASRRTGEVDVVLATGAPPPASSVREQGAP